MQQGLIPLQQLSSQAWDLTTQPPMQLGVGAAVGPQGHSSLCGQPVNIAARQSSLMLAGGQTVVQPAFSVAACGQMQPDMQQAQGVIRQQPLAVGQATLLFPPGLAANPGGVPPAAVGAVSCPLTCSTQGSALHPGLHFQWSGSSNPLPQYSGRGKPWKIALNSEQARSIYTQRPLHHDSHYSKSRSKELAEQYNVNEKTIRDIWNRATWVKATRSLWTQQELDAWAAWRVAKMARRCTRGEGEGRAWESPNKRLTLSSPEARAASKSNSRDSDTEHDEHDHSCFVTTTSNQKNCFVTASHEAGRGTIPAQDRFCVEEGGGGGGGEKNDLPLGIWEKEGDGDQRQQPIQQAPAAPPPPPPPRVEHDQHQQSFQDEKEQQQALDELEQQQHSSSEEAQSGGTLPSTSSVPSSLLVDESLPVASAERRSGGGAGGRGSKRERRPGAKRAKRPRELGPELYLVQAVIGERACNGAAPWEVLVWWKGFPRDEATWEPLDSIPLHFVESYRASKRPKIDDFRTDGGSSDSERQPQ